ncbi:MAG TPA: hypothetical protein VNT22_11745 [Baekduia sp.]|nr:hypothetical protein [Baekduia sp.]
MTDPDDRPDPRPWWDRALDPLRHEAAMFNVLLWTIAIAFVAMVVVLGARALL